MGKYVNPDVLDAALDEIASATRLAVCSDQPEDFADIANVILASATIDSSDFTKSEGDVSGRKVRVAAQEILSAADTGEATHVSLDDGSKLLYVTTIGSPQEVTQGNPVETSAFDIEIEDPE